MMCGFVIFTLLCQLVLGTSDVNTGLPNSLTSEPGDVPYVPKDTRHLKARVHLHNQAPEPTTITATSSVSPTTEPLQTKELYIVDYQEASRRGKTDVVVHLVPRSANIISRELDCFIEYSKRIRKIKKVWGGTAKVVHGNSVHFKTECDNTVTGTRSFGYTIDYKGNRQVANYPIFMDIRMLDDEEFP